MVIAVKILHTVTVTVNPLPSVSVTGGAWCIDAGIQSGLSGGSPAGGTYSGTGVTDNGGTYSFDPTVGTQTLTYNYTDGNSCTNSNTATLTVNPLPTVNVTGGAFCIDAGITVWIIRRKPSRWNL